MSDRLIDADPVGAGLKPIPTALIRYNTEAATPGNTTVALRLASPVVCIMDWGDGSTQFIRAGDYTPQTLTLAVPAGAAGTAQTITHVYPAPGVYDAQLYVLAAARAKLRSGAPALNFGNAFIPNDPGLEPKNLITRLEFLPKGRFSGYGGLASNQPYLTEVVFPISEGIGKFPVSDPVPGNNAFQAAFAGSAITALPRCDFSADAGFSYNLQALCAYASSLISVSTLSATNTNRITGLLSAFYNCSALLSFPALDLSGCSNLSFTWEGCSSMTSFGLCALGSSLTINATWSGCSSLTSFPLMDFSGCTNFDRTWSGCSGLTSFPLIDTSNATSLGGAWMGCSGLTSFPDIDTSSVSVFAWAWANCSGLTSFPSLNTSSGTNFGRLFGDGSPGAWGGCSGLTSFPLLDFSNATRLDGAWSGCSGLTSFPLIDTSACENFRDTWRGCSGLTSFPLLDTSSGTRFNGTWQECSGLTSFPSLNLLSGTNFGDFFGGAWRNCTNLTTFPANMFDGCAATAFDAFTNCALDATSVNNILISIESNGTSNGVLRINGGTSAAPTGAGITARDALIARGWTVATN